MGGGVITIVIKETDFFTQKKKKKSWQHRLVREIPIHLRGHKLPTKYVTDINPCLFTDHNIITHQGSSVLLTKQSIYILNYSRVINTYTTCIVFLRNINFHLGAHSYVH